ncbi:hypothetical protein BZG35_11210 [Brevundimonas sp. LM2]|uniref:hypothetical protein n=1 Tax=Brevundimonas sp. LM2 TaxID=1938605 RepID=UPI000983A2CE|nr:hypothetical protein [Brevundimonas sp. LM2]AQR62148.1 hypothetical protein BZG35_11210 [Brevundimonas sp. LM2]
MFGWFKSKGKSTPKPLYPESRWVVAVDDADIRVRDDKGQEKSVPKAALSSVIIETNDSGPWGADVWWLLFADDYALACSYPQGATGEDAALGFLSSLADFDHGLMIKAMSSTGNAAFPVWRRPV